MSSTSCHWSRLMRKDQLQNMDPLPAKQSDHGSGKGRGGAKLASFPVLSSLAVFVLQATIVVVDWVRG